MGVGRGCTQPTIVVVFAVAVNILYTVLKIDAIVTPLIIILVAIIVIMTVIVSVIMLVIVLPILNIVENVVTIATIQGHLHHHHRFNSIVVRIMVGI